MPTNGAMCAPQSAEEIGPCPRECNGYTPGVYCAWQDWGNWSSCDATCGRGQKTRKRLLTQQENSELPDSIAMLMGMARRLNDENAGLLDFTHARGMDRREKQEYAMVAKQHMTIEQMEKRRRYELAVAFVGGCALCVLAMFALRHCNTNTLNSYADPNDPPAE